MTLSPWASNISPSPTLAVDARVKELIASGEDIAGFGAGEPDFDTPAFIKDACKEALDQGKTKYAASSGVPALRSALAEKYRSFNGIENASAAEVIVSPGGKYSCYLAILATCGPGDEVLIPAPYWVSYPEMVKLAGATPKIIEVGDEQGFKITPVQLEESISEKSKLLILNSPSNPTGAVYSKEELEALMEVVVKHNLYLMSDEIYEYLYYDALSHTSPASFGAEAAARTITVGGFSKTFSMTGWRLGALHAPLEIAKAIGSIQSQTSSNATTFAQWGALAALEKPDLARAALAEMLVAFDRRRLNLLDGLNGINGIKCLRAQGAFYLFPNISSFGLSSNDFAARLLEEAKVAVVPGSGFGADDYIRLSYATSDEIIEKGLNRLKDFCASF
ncbi:pyridoxal phosphate-dependent aminotransferase [Opitutia bacterium ISCC 51]|nr:pyridoxal phosphate-dependent aminotransferase [Opitutae bacterium ISCC 51]QXD28870.1 pyridoxal phosphate-dependent aminotransferase [Opitutae bacterium ISCC 52]